MNGEVKTIKIVRKNINLPSNNKYHFKNLVFEGGGVKGIAYVGALEVLEKEGILGSIERVAGTSAGAMVAVLVALGYTATEISEVLWDINFKNFMDSSWGIVRDINRLVNDYGWYKGDYFRNLMAGYIERKTNNGEITFKELAKNKQFRELHLLGADLTTGYSKVFNAEKTPNVKVADAARISMSIPLFFAARILQAPSYALYTVLIVGYADRQVARKDSAKAQSLAFSMTTIGSVLASLIGGSMFKTAGVRPTMLTATAFAAVGAAIALAATYMKKKAE